MRKKIDLLVLALVVVSGFFAVRNAVAVGDLWHSLHYDPPKIISQIAEDAGMNDRGKQLFYRFSPQLVSQSELDAACSSDKLGCVEGTSLYILDHQTKGEYERSIVTSAHEMLHIAWSRMDEAELKRLETLLENELAMPNAAKIRAKLDGYPKEDRINEAHSFIGSEMRIVSPALEDHYGSYFSDRSKTTRAYIFSDK